MIQLSCKPQPPYPFWLELVTSSLSQNVTHFQKEGVYLISDRSSVIHQSQVFITLRKMTVFTVVQCRWIFSSNLAVFCLQHHICCPWQSRQWTERSSSADLPIIPSVHIIPSIKSCRKSPKMPSSHFVNLYTI